MKTFFLLTFLSLSIEEARTSTCYVENFAKNTFSLPIASSTALTEQQFNVIIDRVERMYAPVIAKMGAKLSIIKNWQDPTPNARADRNGPIWKVYMSGGLARLPGMSTDGFSLVVCHELGHHLGGVPKQDAWSAVEGQADYFAVTKCLRKLFQEDDNVTRIKSLKAPAFVAQNCQKSFSSPNDQALCIRTAMAGKSAMKVIADLMHLPAPEFETPDPTRVSETITYSASPQCRLDTFFQGSLCDVSMNEDFDENDVLKGSCDSLNGHSIGMRPACWYKP